MASAIENDADNVREVLVEGGSKNARLTEIEENARRKGIDVRRVTGQALDGVKVLSIQGDQVMIEVGGRKRPLRVGQHAIGVGFQAMAKQRWPGQLPHQGMRKFVKGIRKNDHLVVFAQLVEKVACAGDRPHLANHLLNVGQTEFLFGKQINAELHQLIVIRLIARRAA